MVSSTFLDLHEERDAVTSVIEDMSRAGWEVERVAMEDIGASPSSPQQASVAMAEHTDLMVLLLGGRYGTVPSDEALSLTNQEYEIIRREKLPCLAYAAEGNDELELDPRVTAFRRLVQDEVVTKPYSGVEGLAEQFRRDIESWLSTFVTPAGARAHGLDTPPGPPLAWFVNREDELGQLDGALTRQSARVGVWGPPGYGKTALVQRYFETHRERLHDPVWLRVEDLFGREPDGRPRFRAIRWEKEALLERLLDLGRERPRSVLVFDNVQAAPRLVSWLSGRLGGQSAVFLSWDAQALPPCHLIPVHPLPIGSADELIANACAPEQIGSAAQVRHLCQRLENHPLLIDLAARRLRLTPSLTVSALIKDLEVAATKLELEGPALDGRIVQVRGMLLSSYRSLRLNERRVLSSLAAAPPSGISDATMSQLLATAGRGELNRLDHAEQLGLLEGRASPDWRGHRFRLRSLIRDFLQTTDAFHDGRLVFEAYLTEPDSLRDESIEVVPMALERQLPTAAPELPQGGDWAEQLLVRSSPAMRARVHSVLSQTTEPEQRAELAGWIATILRKSRPEDVTIELTRLLARLKLPASAGVLRRLWRDPEVADATREPWLSRDVQAAAAQALAELAGLSYPEFLSVTIQEGSRPDREAAIKSAATDKVIQVQPVLVRCLDDPNPRIRWVAADSFGDFDSDPATQERLWRLVESDPDERVRYEAAASLGVWKDGRTVDYFLRQLEDDDPDARGQACSILWRFPSQRAADRLAEVARHDPDPGPRGTATFVLADWEDPRASSICLERLRGPDDYERTVAAGMVARDLGEMPPEVKVAIADELASWLENQPIALRLLARAALITLEDQRCYQGLWGDVSYEASSGEGPYRWFVIHNLAKWTPEGFEPLRLRALLGDPDPSMRASAVLIVGQLRSTQLIPDLEALLEDPAEGVIGRPVAKEAGEALDRIVGKRPPWKPVARASPTWR